MNKTGKPKFFYGYVIALVIFLILAVASGAKASFGIFFLPVLTDLGWTRAMTSSAFSLAMFLEGLLGIVMGRLNDKFGPRLVLTFCGFFMGLGYLLMSQISAIWQLYLFYGVIIGIGTSSFWVPLLSTVARWFTKRRGLMTGVVLIGMSLGSMVMPPVANWLIYTYTWRTSYIIIGVLVLVFITLCAQFLRRTPAEMGLSSNSEKEVKTQSLNLQARDFSLREAIQTRQLWLLIAMNFCSSFGFLAISVHIVAYAIGLGITPANAATILVVLGGAGMTCRIVMGRLGDRIGYKPIYIICFTLMSVALFWLLLARDLWAFYLFAIVLGFGLPVLMAPLTAQLFGLRSHGVIFAFINLGFTFGGAIGSVVAGSIFDITNSYQLAWLACGIFAAVGVIVTLLLKPIPGQGGTND